MRILLILLWLTSIAFSQTVQQKYRGLALKCLMRTQLDHLVEHISDEHSQIIEDRITSFDTDSSNYEIRLLSHTHNMNLIAIVDKMVMPIGIYTYYFLVYEDDIFAYPYSISSTEDFQKTLNENIFQWLNDFQIDKDSLISLYENYFIHETLNERNLYGGYVYTSPVIIYDGQNSGEFYSIAKDGNLQGYAGSMGNKTDKNCWEAKLYRFNRYGEENPEYYQVVYLFSWKGLEISQSLIEPLEK